MIKSDAVVSGQLERAQAGTQSRRLASYLLRFAGYAILIACALFMVVPFLWMLSTSLKTNQHLLTLTPKFFARPLSLESYQVLFAVFPLLRMIGNSLVVASLTTIGRLLTSAMAAYAFARMQFRGSQLLFMLYLATLMVPQQVTIIPLFILMKDFGWINSYSGLIVPGLFSAFGTFMLRQYFVSLPRDLDESAFIDGASHLDVFWRIILPLSKPALATLTVFLFMGSWNDFLWPLFIVREEVMMTLPVGLAALNGQYLSQWNLIMAGSVISVIPMIVLYLFAQKYVVQGFVRSGLKS